MGRLWQQHGCPAAEQGSSCVTGAGYDGGMQVRALCTSGDQLCPQTGVDLLLNRMARPLGRRRAMACRCACACIGEEG